jgi:phosphoserine aminotransferase
MPNTPSCYSIYMCGLFLEYVKEKGGIPYFSALSKEKSRILYEAIDGSDGFYVNKIDRPARSRINIPFHIKGGTPALETLFCVEAREAGMIYLEGHASLGGMRASIYNGMPVEGVQKLIAFMGEFKSRHNK